MQDGTALQATSDTAVRARWIALIALIVVYTLNFVDRQILSILKEPIAAELHLSDTQLGLLGGFAFALFYSVLAIPAAWLADRTSRTWVIAGGLLLWSGFTGMSGLASGFALLFVARMGVGVGEAGGVAPAYSLIADYFPPGLQARALALYSFGIPVGSAAGVLFGGLVAHAVNWRFAFLVLGAVGIVLVPAFLLTVRDPPRRASSATRAPLALHAVARLAARKPTFWLLAFGCGSSSLVAYGLMYWLPTFLARSLGMDLVARSELLAAVILIGGVIGMGGGGWLADRLGARSKRGYARVPAVAFLASAPLFALAILAVTPAQTFALLLVPYALALVWLGPVLAAVQHLAPAASRSTMSALFLLVNNLIGLGVGPYLFGWLSDLLKPAYGAESIKVAFLIGLGFYVIAAVLLWFASRHIERDWVD
ncbi:MAG: MFS transporter [Proteobacteria bacterium]|nr:MFS transporter [Pseudomonadota bacterium]